MSEVPRDPDAAATEATLRAHAADPLTSAMGAEEALATESDPSRTDPIEVGNPTVLPPSTRAARPAPGDNAATDRPETPVPTSRMALTPGSTNPSEAASFGPIALQGQPEPGLDLFGRYRIEAKLGEGGMGTVWLVRHLELNVLRALKLIISGIAFDPDARARFRREARVMALLTHPNAVIVHDARIAEDVAFIEMEYVRGQSLNKLMKQGVPMPLDWIARIVEQLCDVLEAAHDLKIVHRDLKPANLMLVEGREAGREHLKVLDFGIAKILESEADTGDVQTRTGSFLGSAPYSSPEQVSGAAVDARSDLYSVGVILYEFLTGSRPFIGPIHKLVYDQLYTLPPPFASRSPGLSLPPEVEAVVLRCLAKKPEARPQTARELVEEFRRALPAGLVGAPAQPRSSTDVRPGLDLPPTEDAVRVPYVPADLPPTERAEPGDVPPEEPPTKAGAPVLTVAPAKPSTTPRRPVLLMLAVVVFVLGVVAAGLFAFSQRDRGSGLPEGYKADDAADLVGGLPRVLVRQADGTRFLRILGGEFAMGNSGFASRGSNEDEDQPAHPVTLSDYYIQETEVTNGELDAYFRKERIAPDDRPKRWRKAWDAIDTAARDPKPYPAVGVSHELAERYAASVGGTLPTEAQWEYAARSRGKNNPYSWGTAGGGALKNANINSLGLVGQVPTFEVGKFPKDRTEEGVLDLIGNVREWCRDAWSEYVASDTPARDPSGPAPSSGQAEFVIRGGSFATWADQTFTTRPRRPDKTELTAKELAEDGGASDLGFRVVLEWPGHR